jgi:hypothetical protein
MKNYLQILLALFLCLGQAQAQGSYRLLGIADPSNGHFRQTPDGGYLLSGSYAQGGQNAGMVAVKLDGDFQVQWSKVLQSSNGHLDYGIDAIPTPDGGYAVLGAVDTEPWNNPILAKMDYCLIKLDAAGDIQWAKRYGGNRTDLPYELSLTQDGGFFISGYASRGTDALGNPKPYLVKTDAAGNLEWSFLQQNFAFNITLALLAHPSFQMKGIPTQDGGYCYAVSTGETGFVVKLDQAGQVAWKKSLPMGGSAMGGEAENLWGVAASGGFLADIEELPNGDFAILGNVFYFIAIGLDGNSNYVYIPVAFLMRLTASGEVVEASAFFHPSGQPNNATDLYATDLSRLPNGTFLITGSIAGNQSFQLAYDPSITALNQSTLWAEKFGWMNASGYPYDYDFPRLGFTHEGNYVSFYDAMRLHILDKDNPAGNSCSVSMSINSFPFTPVLTSNPTVTADSLGQAIDISYQATALSGVEDTTLCGMYALAVDQAELLPALEVYPNPAQDLLTVEVPTAFLSQRTQLRVVDLQGRLLMNNELPAGTLRQELNLASLPAGLYVLQLQAEQQLLSRRFLKQ